MLWYITPDKIDENCIVCLLILFGSQTGIIVHCMSLSASDMLTDLGCGVWFGPGGGSSIPFNIGYLSSSIVVASGLVPSDCEDVLIIPGKFGINALVV